MRIAWLFVIVLLSTAHDSAAQLASPNRTGVSMGHLHYRVKDVSAAKYVILDEIHYLSSYKAKRSKAVKKYIEHAEPHGVIGLSGTPMLVRPKDIWHPLDLLWPDRFGNFFSFSQRFCDGQWVEIEGVDRKVRRSSWKGRQ